MSLGTKIRAVAVLSLLLAAGLPAAVAAQPPAEETRVAGQLGWSWAPNGAFERNAAKAGVPLAGAPVGGPTLLGVFGYQLNPSWEIAIELGVELSRLSFQQKPAYWVATLPLVVAARWFPPLDGKLTPYLGAGGGYYLNFYEGGSGAFESHTAGLFGAAGAIWPIDERVALIGELRYVAASSAFPAVGALNVGGVSLSIGAQISFPPEKRELR